jgi:aldehyde dehydrogenase (NAD+)
MNISELVSHQKEAFRTGINRTYEKRRAHLQVFRTMISEHEEQLCEAINHDFGKPAFESYSTEIYVLLHEIDVQLKNLSKWMAPESVGGPVVTFPSKYVIHKQPLGTVLIISAWNYPVHLSLMPLAGSLAAGNTAILKPSGMAPATSGLIHKLIEQEFDPKVLTVVQGNIPETSELLKQPFDKIFFTGSTRVGKIVMKAAAEQLIPVTLELGGKSPAIVHKDANILVSAKRIMWGKTINAGQTCVAPDFAAVHQSQKKQFTEMAQKTLSGFFRDDYRPGINYTRIVNREHFNRLKKLMDGGHVLSGGSTNAESLFIEPTLMDADWDDEIMQEEIFGPLLPVVSYNNENELIERLQFRPSPLALYLFTDDQHFQTKIFDNVPFGGGCVNDTITHLGNPNLPFGGVGESGIGTYHGKASFDTFSRPQSVLKKSFWPDPDIRYPPYNEKKLTWFKRLFS